MLVILLSFVSLLCCFVEGAFITNSQLDQWLAYREHSSAYPRGDLPAPQYHLARQDNFDGSNPNQWYQAYYVNATYWKQGSDAPVFLCIGGEGPPLTPHVVVDSVHCSNAVEFLAETGAIMFALEHRYYGCHNMSACPVQSFSRGTADLKFLSSRQAVADVATFVAYATKTYNLTASNRWVAWGGSYPGMLASFVRLKLPQLIFAAVASSAPVEGIVDFEGYNNVVAEAYSVSDNGVGGSSACTSAIAAAHATIGELFGSPSGRQRLASLFPTSVPSAEWLTQRSNQIAFAGYGAAFFPAQSNDPSCTADACNIARICSLMVNDSNGVPLERLSKVAALQQPSITAVRAMLSSESAGLPNFWGYQTCTEWGFYQTCNVGSKCFFVQGLVNVTVEESFCSTTFGIDFSLMQRNVAFSNAFYGGWHPASSRVLFVNGEVDPWHAASVLVASPGRPILWVPGSSHHAWTHPSAPTDQRSVVLARQQIRRQVLEWLRSP